MYELKITKFEVNENYKEESKQFADANRFSSIYENSLKNPPLRQIKKRHLEVTITDKEFEVIKKEVLKVI